MRLAPTQQDTDSAQAWPVGYPQTPHRGRSTVSSDAPGIVIILILGLAAFAFWIWAIVDVVRVPDDSMFKAGNKLVWILVIVITGVIGAIIYLVVGRPAPGSLGGAMSPPADPDRPPPPPPGAIG